MAKNVKINGVTYSDVPSVEIPLAAGGGNAEFFDTSDATLDSGGKMLSGNTAYADGVKYTGTVYVPSALISSYQTASNWSTLYNNGTLTFAAIEGSPYQL